jgi:hypothetical protein
VAGTLLGTQSGSFFLYDLSRDISGKETDQLGRLLCNQILLHIMLIASLIFQNSVEKVTQAMKAMPERYAKYRKVILY